MNHTRPLFSLFSAVNSKYVHYKFLPMTGFELRTFGFGSDRSANYEVLCQKCTFWTGIRTGAFHTKVVHFINLEPSFVSVSEITFFVKKCSLSVLIFEISLKSNLGQTREASFIKFRRNYQNFLKSKKWFCPNNFFSQTFKDGKAWGVEGNETSAEGIEVQKQWCQHIST